MLEPLELLTAKSGDEIETTGFGGATPASFTIDTEAEQFAGISKALTCSTPGTRLTIVVPPVDVVQFGTPWLSQRC